MLLPILGTHAVYSGLAIWPPQLCLFFPTRKPITALLPGLEPECLSVLWDAAGPGCLLPGNIPKQRSGLCRRFQFWLNKGYGVR